MTWFTCALVLPCCLCTETMEWGLNSTWLRYGDCQCLPNANCGEKNFESGAKWEVRSGFRKQDFFFFRLMEKHIPSKIICGDKKNKPWITSSKTSQVRHKKRNKLFKKLRATKRAKDNDSFWAIYEWMKAKILRVGQAYWQHLGSSGEWIHS